MKRSQGGKVGSGREIRQSWLSVSDVFGDFGEV